MAGMSSETERFAVPREDAPSGSRDEPEAKRLRLDSEPGTEELEAPSNVAMSSGHIPIFDYEHLSVPTSEVKEQYYKHFIYLTTRKEQKSLDKEIPWHLIPPEHLSGFMDALSSEWDVWQKSEAVRPLSLEASKATRVCYRNKNAAYPWMPYKYKARIVCRGDNDPDLTSLRRDAPTLTRLALMVILQLASSMSGWFLFNSDITGAFLQGDQKLASRKEALYLRQPREGLPGLLRGQLLLVVRGIFGLANSPRLFWRHLRDTLIKLGFVQSTLDRALFLYYLDNQLVLAMGAHVDDLIGCGKPGAADKVLQELLHLRLRCMVR